MEDNILKFPGNETEVEEVTENTIEAAIEDSDNPLNDVSMKNISAMLKQAEMMVGTLRSVWESDMREYKVNDKHIKDLYQWNEEHSDPMPDSLSEEEKQNWDRFNGLNSITEEEIVRIFGDEHEIIGVDHQVTIDRVKTIINDYILWLTSLKEYRQIHDAYISLIEMEEEKNIAALKEVANKEEDPEKKQRLLDDINRYEYNKYLDFLKDPITDTEKETLKDALDDKQKLEYWTKRSRDKLRQLKVSESFLLEIAGFEKNFLGEEYEKCKNILLVYFMKLITYTNLGDKKDIMRMRIVSFVFAIDSLIRNQMKEDVKDRVVDNIKTFCNNFI